MQTSVLGRLAVFVCLAFESLGAHAQVPPHVPGTICATPQFWCYAVYPGPPGTRCVCQLPQYGWVQGVLI